MVRSEETTELAEIEKLIELRAISRELKRKSLVGKVSAAQSELEHFDARCTFVDAWNKEGASIPLLDC